MGLGFRDIQSGIMQRLHTIWGVKLASNTGGGLQSIYIRRAAHGIWKPIEAIRKGIGAIYHRGFIIPLHSIFVPQWVIGLVVFQYYSLNTKVRPPQGQ